MAKIPDEDRLLDWLFELGQLKRLPRTGWFRAGIDRPESVAEHNLRAAQLAYVLAHMEGHPDPERVCTIAVFHEIGETRVTDLDHVAKLYTERAEERAARDQLEGLNDLGDEVAELWEDCEKQRTKAGRIAKDADKLEAAIQAREYIETGHQSAHAWIEDTKQILETDSAKRLIEALEEKRSDSWWKRMDFDDIRG